MEKMGYIVDQVARNKNGDQGIDRFAYRQTVDKENWVIQCKCYGKDKVGPAVIRELIGTLTLHKQKVNECWSLQVTSPKVLCNLPKMQELRQSMANDFWNCCTGSKAANHREDR